MIRTALSVWAPLCVALALGVGAGLGVVSLCEQLGVGVPPRFQAFPVIGLVVLFGFRGAVESGHRLAHLLGARGVFHPGARR